MQGSKVASQSLTYTQVFSQWLCDMAKIDNNFIAITPAMREGSGMVEFAKEYPERFFDVGIAEQHAITFAGGVATQGVKPVVAIYSTFLQRGYDQLIHDVALQNLPVMFAIDRAGIVGPDGPTHIGAFDISYLICIPNMIVMTPSDENQCYQMLYTALKTNAPCTVRYPRGYGSGTPITLPPTLLPIGKGVTVRNGNKIAILVFGTLLKQVLIAAEELNATVCDMRFAKPIDIELLQQIYANYDIVVTVEENVIIGGAGSYCTQLAQTFGFKIPTLNLGLPDSFLEHGDANKLLARCGLDSQGILNSINQFIKVVTNA
jgi:1-deoxy-D-xylulose-5-phosphate synthase